MVEVATPSVKVKMYTFPLILLSVGASGVFLWWFCFAEDEGAKEFLGGDGGDLVV